jgi:hypothetical protein
MSLDDSDSDELVIMHDEEGEPSNSECQIANVSVEISANNIKEEKQEPVEEIKVAYQCTEVRRIRTTKL